MNKVWEVIEKEAREGTEGKHHYRRGMRKSMRDDEYRMQDNEASYRSYRRSDETEEAYECGFEDGYSEAMKKIFRIIKDAD